MKILDWYLTHVKAHWAFVIVLLTTAFCTYLTLEPGLEVTSFKVNAVVIGFLGSSAIVAAAVRAYPSMFLMFVCSLFLADHAGAVHARGHLQGRSVRGVDAIAGGQHRQAHRRTVRQVQDRH